MIAFPLQSGKILNLDAFMWFENTSSGAIMCHATTDDFGFAVGNPDDINRLTYVLNSRIPKAWIESFRREEGEDGGRKADSVPHANAPVRGASIH